MPIELLAPAGSPEALNAAIGEGADAVYLGLKNPNSRIQSAGFTYPQFEAALRSLRRMGKKCYVTINTVFEQREVDRIYQLLKYLSSLGPDALIVQDFGILAMLRSEFPNIKLHAAAEMNIACDRGANALSRHGVSRVALARELSLEEMKSLRADTNMELEVLVHGALCISASGLCLFSSCLGGKSANRGICTQACRRLYHKEDSAADVFTHEGDADHGYYFSPGDLQLIERLPDLAAAGINAVRIEGRMKSADYVGTVVSAYRLVLDSIAEGSSPKEDGDDKIRQSIAKGLEILRGDFARSKTTFYFDAPQPQVRAAKRIDWLNPAQDGGLGINLGVITKIQGKDDTRRGFVPVSGNKPKAGDSIRLHSSDDSKRVSHKVQFAEAVAGGFWFSVPEGFGRGDRVYLSQTKAMSKRYKPVIAGNVSRNARPPGHDKAPLPPMSPVKTPARNKASVFPEGLYLAVSRIEDLYIVQSSRPARVMLKLTRKTAGYLLNEDKPPLPFKPAEIILTLDPYFPQAAVAPLADEIEQLVDMGYRQFVVNNLGHFSLFRNFRGEIQMIAGPWLYMFNSWALAFLASLGVDGFVSPLENNRQNLERTLNTGNRQAHSTGYAARSPVFIPVFAWPPLFHIRADLTQVYGAMSFSDNRDELFSLICEPEGSQVILRKPFSITDKIPFLREAGFRRFIIDLSGPPLKKTDYKDLMRAVNNGAPLPNINRFNWKDGFYSTENKHKK